MFHNNSHKEPRRARWFDWIKQELHTEECLGTIKQSHRSRSLEGQTYVDIKTKLNYVVQLGGRE